MLRLGAYQLGKGKTVDLVAKRDGKSMTVEIETGKSEAIYNIRKDVKAGFDKVVCVASNGKVRDKIVC
jgi:Holliday junction resolvase